MELVISKLSLFPVLFIPEDQIYPFMQIGTHLLTLQFLPMRFNEVIPNLFLHLRVGVAIRHFYVVHSFAVLLHPEVEVLAIYQEFREVVKFRD